MGRVDNRKKFWISESMSQTMSWMSPVVAKTMPWGAEQPVRALWGEANAADADADVVLYLGLSRVQAEAVVDAARLEELGMVQLWAGLLGFGAVAAGVGELRALLLVVR